MAGRCTSRSTPGLRTRSQVQLLKGQSMRSMPPSAPCCPESPCSASRLLWLCTAGAAWPTWVRGYLDLAHHWLFVPQGGLVTAYARWPRVSFLLVDL